MSDEKMVASVLWALGRMVELRKAGAAARFRVTWRDYAGRREYRLEIRRGDGVIERPIVPFPLGGGQSVEESDEGSCKRSREGAG